MTVQTPSRLSGRDSSRSTTSSTARLARRAGRRPRRRSACRRRARRRRACSTGAVKAPSATVRRSASRSAARRAFADALAEAEVARAGRRAGEDEVAEAGEAGQRLGARALGEAEAGHLGKAARDQGGAGVLAEPPALDHAAGDGEHVLDRAADLGAGDVVGQIGAEEGPGDAARASRSPSARSSTARVTAVGRPAATSWAKVGPGKHGDRRAGLHLARDLVHQHAGRVLDPLGAEDRAACRAAGRPRSTARRCWAGVTTRKASQLGQRGEVAGGADRRAELHAGEEELVLVRRVDRLDDLGLARPEQGLRRRPPPRPGRARCPRRRRRSTPILMPSLRRRAPSRPPDRAASGRGPARRAPSIRPGVEAQRAGPGDHRRIVGAQPERRRDEGQAVRRRRARSGRARIA